MELAGELALVFLVVALLLGAAARHLLRNTPIPYTVILLLLGLGLGGAVRARLLDGSLHALGAALNLASAIDPHLILFVFLPALLFESAFAMDVHTFRRTFGQVMVLAVPGLLISTFVVAAAAMLLFPWGWTWPVALMFGALLSATDPVAVVALLRELGASKRLATIIEGESLLNDGTAIVVFSAFLGTVALGSQGTLSISAVEFIRVSAGGVLVGWLAGWLAIVWIGRVFNDALIEITLTISFAYLVFIVAERGLHVSGVLAVVSFGLLFAGPGRTRVSPEVGHFLHRFWEMAAYLANTLIFVLVGVVIALQTQWSDARLWGVLGILYVTIHVARMAANIFLYPVLRVQGYGMSWRENVVLTWGGLRGAVGLALALMVARDARISPELGGQVLFLTAGIVVLTLVVNGTTMRPLLEWLGLDRISAARQMALDGAARVVAAETADDVKALQQDPFLRGADWETVRRSIKRKPRVTIDQSVVTQSEQFSELRRRVLTAEKQSYWRQFQEGTLGGAAVGNLTAAADAALDAEGEIGRVAELRSAWHVPVLLSMLQQVPFVGDAARYFYFDRLSFGYDVARGYLVAQEEATRLLPSMTADGTLRKAIEAGLGHARSQVITFVTRLRGVFPEITTALETKAAVRSGLHHERKRIEELVEAGMLEESEAERWIAEVEHDMKRATRGSRGVKLPGKEALLREIPWLRVLPAELFRQVTGLVKERMYEPGEDLVREGGEANGLFIIARGSVRVVIGDLLLDILGPGSVVGEMAVLASVRRTATVRAESPVEALWVGAEELKPILAQSDVLEKAMWETAGRRFAENILAGESPYLEWGKLKLRRWLLKGSLTAGKQGERFEPKRRVVLVAGQAESEDGAESVAAPAAIPWPAFRMRSDGRFFVCAPTYGQASRVGG